MAHHSDPRQRTLGYVNAVRVTETYTDLLASEVVQALLTRYADAVPVRVDGALSIPDVRVNAAFEDAPLLYALQHVAEFCNVAVSVSEYGVLVFRGETLDETAARLTRSLTTTVPGFVEGGTVYLRSTMQGVRHRQARRKRASS